MPVTLSDIADALHLSKMTVSRAINNDPKVSETTRLRVLELAKKLGYHPNQHARALATRRSLLIGLVVPDLMNSYFAELMKGIEEVCRPAGYQLLICNTDEDAERELAEVQALRFRTDALIIATCLASHQAKPYRRMIREGANIVLVDRALSNLACPVVTTDNVRVGLLATEHLIALGRERVGHLRGTAVTTAEDRYKGFRLALEHHGRAINHEMVRPCGFLEAEGYRATNAWIHEKTLPQAIFAVNDAVAIGALQALQQARIRVPQETAIVGAGDIHYAAMLGTPLSSVNWSILQMGRSAAQLSLAQIEKTQVGPAEGKAVVVTVEPHLVIRNSSQRVNNRNGRRVDGRIDSDGDRLAQAPAAGS